MSVRPSVLSLAAVLLVGCSYGHLTESGDRRPAPGDCGACHVEVYEEWRASAHAKAYTRESYVELTAGHTVEGCLSCHAPDSIYVRGAVRVRSVRRHQGVDCISCHLDGDALVGPLPADGVVQPHPVRQERPLYLKSDLCGRCHEVSFEQWTSAPARAPDGSPKRTCQECHMPAVQRTVTQATDTVSSLIVALESRRPQRRHTFDLSAVRGFEGGVDLEIVTAAGAVEVVVHNHLPHNLPTGAFGARTLEAEVVWSDRSGVVVSRTRLSYSARLGTAVAPYGADRRRVEVPPGAVYVEVRLIRPDRGSLAGFEVARTKRRLP